MGNKVSSTSSNEENGIIPSLKLKLKAGTTSNTPFENFINDNTLQVGSIWRNPNSNETWNGFDAIIAESLKYFSRENKDKSNCSTEVIGNRNKNYLNINCIHNTNKEVNGDYRMKSEMKKNPRCTFVLRAKRKDCGDVKISSYNTHSCTDAKFINEGNHNEGRERNQKVPRLQYLDKNDGLFSLQPLVYSSKKVIHLSIYILLYI